MALYIADIASNHAVATITRRLCSITERHRASGFANSPAKAHHLVVSEIMKGIRRVFGTVQKGKSPLLTADIRKIVSKCPRGTRGDRDKLLILIGFATRTSTKPAGTGAVSQGALSSYNLKKGTLDERRAVSVPL